MSTIAAVYIGERLKELRQGAVLTQAELGKLAGVDRDQVSRIERDVVEPRPATIRALAHALSVEPKELLK